MLQPGYQRSRFGGIILLCLLVVLLEAPSVVDAAGTEEVFLIDNVGVTPQDTTEDITYSCTFRNLWTPERQPINFPQGRLAHWAGPIAWTSTLQYRPWAASYPVTRGLEKLAEDGFTDVLKQEMEQQGGQVLEWVENPDSYLWVEVGSETYYGADTNDYYVHLPPLKASSGYPYLTMVAGMAPSPDWFTGFYLRWLIDEYSRTWYDHIKVQVYPWDAGTDEGTTYESPDRDLDPPLEVQRFSPRYFPEGGELTGPDGTTVPVVGEFECLLTVGPEPLILPDCDWILNPCCNETDTVTCGKVLPNGRIPETSPEVAEMLQGGPEAPNLPTHSPAPTSSQSSPTVSDGGGGGGGCGNTVLDVIRSNPDLSNFSIALEYSGLDAVLGDCSREFTVFAPSNQAIEDDPVFSIYMTLDGWIHHLRTNIQLMVLPVKLQDNEIFDEATTELVSLNGTLQISQPFAMVNLVSVKTPNLVGSNGVVHIMNGVVKNDWREYTLRDVDQHEGLAEELSPILTRIGFDEPLNEFVPKGSSWIASRNRGYGDDSIALGYYDIVEELKDPDNEEFQYMAYMYNLIDFNVYEQDIEPGFQLLVMPRGDLAHMWLTKDVKTGQLRFNDAVLDRQALADNGVTQIVTKPLVPPGIAMIMDYSAEYTTINLKDMAQYYKSSEWNLRNLTTSIGTQQGSLSVFAPLQDGYGEFNIEVGVRISTLEWKRHLWDFLLHMTFEPGYTTDEIFRLVENNGGYMQMKMLSGFNTTLEFDQDGELTIDGARLLRPYDMKGIDGYIHLVEQVPLPPSVLYTVYDQTQQNPDMTTVTSLIDTVQMGVFIDNLLPLTFFSVVDGAWDIIVPTLEIEDVLKNHIFELLWFDDYLAGLREEKPEDRFITSTNGKRWNVQVFDDPDGIPLKYAPEQTPVKIYISNAEGPEGLTNCTFIPGPNRTNILARTGVIHHMNCLLLDYNYTKIDADAPTFAPVQQVTGEPAVLTSAPIFTTASPIASPVNESGLPGYCFGNCPCGSFFSLAADSCVELTCENWQLSTPTNEVAHSPAPCQDEFHFCGNDGVCHPYNCENWYQHGPGEFTGYSLSHAVELTCDDYDGGSEDNANAIVHGCRPYQPGRKAPSAINSVFFFNQECKASYVGREFRCYQNKEGTDYNEFLGEVARANLDACDIEIHQFEQPVYWYQIFMEQEVPGGEIISYQGSRTQDGTNGVSFDPSKADRTIYSIITGGNNFTSSSDPASDECAAQTTVADECIAANSCEALGNVGTFDSAQLEILMVDFLNDIEILMDNVDGVVDRINAFLVDFCDYYKTYACEVKSSCPACGSEFDKFLGCISDVAMRDAEQELADLNTVLEGAAIESEVSYDCDVGELVCSMDSNATEVDSTVPPDPIDMNATVPPAAIPPNTTLVQINTTFAVFNMRGLTAKDLLLPENRAILYQALADFIADLVNQVENADDTNQQSGRFLRLDSSRRWLQVALHPGSTTIVDIRDVECRLLEEIPPENATCQNVFGHYDLQVDDDQDKEVVYETYVQATDEAIQEGKLQESLVSVSADMDVPFVVAGPVKRETPAPETAVPVNTVTVPPTNTKSQDSEDGGVEWWVILLSCLSAVTGCCLVSLAGMLLCKKKEDRATGNDEDNGETSIKFAPIDDEMTPLEGPPEEEPNDEDDEDDDDDGAGGSGGEVDSHELGKDGLAQESPLLPEAMEAPQDFQEKQAPSYEEEWG